MLIGRELEAHNKRFSDACADARVWLAEQLRDKGHDCKIVDHAVVTTKTKGKYEESTLVKIHIHFRQFSREADGILVKVHRQRHPITFRREDTEWKSFDWDKVIAHHLTELDAVLERAVEWQEKRETQDKMLKLAKQEVWLPEGRFGRFGETALAGSTVDFTRHRNEDGTYRAQLSGNFTLEETLQLRAIAFAAHNRSGGKPIVVPKNENTEKAAS